MIRVTVGIDGQVCMCCPLRPLHESIHSLLELHNWEQQCPAWEHPYSSCFPNPTINPRRPFFSVAEIISAIGAGKPITIQDISSAPAAQQCSVSGLGGELQQWETAVSTVYVGSTLAVTSRSSDASPIIGEATAVGNCGIYCLCGANIGGHLPKLQQWETAVSTAYVGSTLAVTSRSSDASPVIGEATAVGNCDASPVIGEATAVGNCGIYCLCGVNIGGHLPVLRRFPSNWRSYSSGKLRYLLPMWGQHWRSPPGPQMLRE
ncbi:hypothetical protein J6590_073234 [Homalodisca vitripennis]|nr:hypothetical protein J6590_073234 [Homalodisca vitripennis]